MKMNKPHQKDKAIIKEYKFFHNLSLDNFYNREATKVKSIMPYREDIDFPKNQPITSNMLEEYSKKIIREYLPWEYKMGEKTLAVGSPLSSGNIRPGTVLKTDDSKTKKSSKGLIATILAIVLTVLAKFKGLVFILLSKLAPLLTILGEFKAVFITFGSMILSLFAYALIFKWQLALGLIFLIFIHEMGHAMVIYMRGIRAGLPVFIPFMGAFIALRQMPKDVATEAHVAIGGPLLGTFGAFVLYLLYIQTQYELWLVLAHIGFLLNLFNLTPVSPMDGGRIVAAISTKIWILGFLILLGMTFVFKTPVLILILVFAFMNLINRPKANKDYYEIPGYLRLAYAFSYFALVLFLFLSLLHTTALLQNINL